MEERAGGWVEVGGRWVVDWVVYGGTRCWRRVGRPAALHRRPLLQEWPRPPRKPVHDLWCVVCVCGPLAVRFCWAAPKPVGRSIPYSLQPELPPLSTGEAVALHLCYYQGWAPRGRVAPRSDLGKFSVADRSARAPLVVGTRVYQNRGMCCRFSTLRQVELKRGQSI